MAVKAIPPRYSVTEGVGELEVVIPVRKHWYLIPFYVFWFVMAWVMVTNVPIIIFSTILTFVNQIRDNPSALGPFLIPIGFLVLIFVFMVFILLFGVQRILWSFAGKEVVVVNHGSIRVFHHLFWMGKPREYLAEHVRDLRASMPGRPFPGSRSFKEILAHPGMQGAIAFDYGARTYRFGAEMDEAEARMIVNDILQRYPQYGLSVSKR